MLRSEGAVKRGADLPWASGLSEERAEYFGWAEHRVAVLREGVRTRKGMVSRAWSGS